MAGGYTGKVLFVNLSTGEVKAEAPEESLYRDFIGGYGLGARVIFDRQKAGVDALGPENILGLVTGPLTGTPAPMGSRYVVVGKSPLTGGWGDANSGGDWGPHLKFAGYDAVFFSGIADRPVYLFIDNGQAEIKDAAHLWGKDACDTEDMLRAAHGKDTYVSCIGPSGEKLSLISCVITKRGAAAGRSGLGALMGSKRLKAVAVKGNQAVPLASKTRANQLRREHIADLRKAEFRGEPFWEQRRKYGTSFWTYSAAHNGDAPVKNWGGIGVIDFADAWGISGDAVIANKDKPESCWGCPLACQALMKEGKGEYQYPAGARRPEYETMAAFGVICLNNNTDSIILANDICNRYGLDTISAGATIAFAIECYENGLISQEDTGGIELTWGNHQAIVAMTEKLAKREGFGDILADGVKVAAEKIGKGAEEYAIHIGGQELPMHDPKAPVLGPGLATRYQLNATPGRHTGGFGSAGFLSHVLNASGLCTFGYGPVDVPRYITGFMSAVTGWERTIEELLKDGERIANIRQAFNSREGINHLPLKVPSRMLGSPPQTEGPLKGVTTDLKTQARDELKALDWDLATAKPSKKKLRELGLDDVAQELYP